MANGWATPLLKFDGLTQSNGTVFDAPGRVDQTVVRLQYRAGTQGFLGVAQFVTVLEFETVRDVNTCEPKKLHRLLITSLFRYHAAIFPPKKFGLNLEF